MLQYSVTAIQKALQQNNKCVTGLLVQQGVFYTQQGPSGGPEILALLYANDAGHGYFYGHILQHPDDKHHYVAVIVWAKKFINAPTNGLLFAEFHYWIKERLEYEPCSSQFDGDCYAEASTLSGAVDALKSMIASFELEKRYAYEGSPYEGSPIEMRILDIYGFGGIEGKNDPLDRPNPVTTLLCVVK